MARQLGCWGLSLLGAVMVETIAMTSIAWAEQPLMVVYPPDNHETTASQIFLIGTAPAPGEVTVNGQVIQRSNAGHFAPSFPLQLGENVFTLRYQDQTVTVRVTRQSGEPPAPNGVAFGEGSLSPSVDIARQPGEPICFSAIAPANATVAVYLVNQVVPLLPQSNVTLPPNSAVLTTQNQPVPTTVQTYQGCSTFNPYAPGMLAYGTIIPGSTPDASFVGVDLGQPRFVLNVGDRSFNQLGTGRITILSPINPTVVEVTAESGTARTGASTDFSRLTPLPKGTRASVTGWEGDWLRLDYGAWIRASETQVLPNAALPRSIIRSVTSRQTADATEIVFPLQVPVPVSVNQGDRTFTLTLYNTTAQTDTIRLDDDPIIERLDWQQPTPGQVQYTFNLKTAQQWGYQLRYEGTTLILALRHPPRIGERRNALQGARILLDPGHGGPEDLGARGSDGTPEKEVALTVSRLLRDELVRRGATVYLTREGDADLFPQDRVNLINQLEPTIALSLHYNALPDSGDAQNTAGIGTFWYNAQAHSLAVFLHNYLVERLDRPSYGVFWNNLALTRPTIAPAVLLELGFMINPTEFEWIVNPEEQQRLAIALADGIEEWLKQHAAQDEE